MMEFLDLPKIIFVELQTFYSFDFDTFNQFFSWMTKHIKHSEKNKKGKLQDWLRQCLDPLQWVDVYLVLSMII